MRHPCVPHFLHDLPTSFWLYATNIDPILIILKPPLKIYWMTLARFYLNGHLSDATLLLFAEEKQKHKKRAPASSHLFNGFPPPELRIRSEGAGRKLNAGLRQLLHSWEEGIHPVILQVGHPEIRKLGYPSPNQANLPCLGPGQRLDDARIRAPTLVCLF